MPKEVRRVAKFVGLARRTGVSVALAALALVALPRALQAQEPPVTRYLVQVALPTLESAKELAAAGFDVAGVNRAEKTAGVVATYDELKRLYALGWFYTIERLNTSPESTTSLAGYTDPGQMSAFMDQIVAAYPSLAQKVALTPPLFEWNTQYALKITKDVGVENDRPSFIFDAQHHPREVMTAEIAKDMMDYLTRFYDVDSQVRGWVDNLNIWIVPIVNPDGATYVFTTDNTWNKNRHPICAVDVGRNYPFAWGACGGSSAVCSDETFRGSSPGSEPETQGIMQLTARARPFFSLSYHSYGETISYPYACYSHDEAAAMSDVAMQLNAILLDDAGGVGGYSIGGGLYEMDGASIDTQYAQYGTYAFLIEVNASSYQPDYQTWRSVTVQRQRTAWQYFLNQTFSAPQIRGTVTDATTGLPIVANVALQEVTFTHGESPRQSDAKGHYYWLARPGQTYHVTISKDGYCPFTQTVTVGSGPAIVDAALAALRPPATVSAAAAGDNAIDVSWSPAVAAVDYRVLRSLDPGGPYVQVGAVAAPATVFHDTGVSGTATYHYVVRSFLYCGESEDSEEASASTTGPCFVGPAFAGIASVTNPAAATCTMDLSWEAASPRCGGAVTYSVHRSTLPSFVPDASNRIASGLTTTAYSDTSALADGTTYYYLVRSVDTGNGADDGNSVVLSSAPTGPVASGTWTDDAGDTETAKLELASPWSVLATGGKAFPKAYATGNYANSLCAAVTTPVIYVQSTSVLSFASKYDIESNWDAGIVEVAQGPTFGTWTRLTTVNYPDSLLNTGNACGFPKSYGATVFSRTYATPAYPVSDYTGSLAAFAGKDIKLRWRISSDATGTGKGWWVDDIAVTNATFNQTCATATPTSGPLEVSPDPWPMLASRPAAGTAVELTYTPACRATNDAVYWGYGPIAGSPSWTNAACALGISGAASFDPGDPAPGTFVYFVIVGQNATWEGSYGHALTGTGPVERPEAVGVGGCDLPQDLTGVCP
jgi:hypothetical protein